MKHTNTDKDLFKLITNDNEAAFSELFRRYDRHIYPFVLKMIKSASLAEALTVAIFSKIWQNRKELAFVDVPDEYIYNIACIAIAKQ